MDFENLVIACLIFEKSGFHLDIKKTFFNVQIDEALREEKDEILKKFQKIKETEKMVDVLALHFYLKIYVKKPKGLLPILSVMEKTFKRFLVLCLVWLTLGNP